MAKDRKPKVPKIIIPKVDLKTFLLKDMQIDPYWSDVYNAPPKKKKR